MKISFALVLALVAICNGQRRSFGASCPSYTAPTALDMTQVDGKYYIHAKLGDKPLFGNKCDYLKYTLDTVTPAMSIEHKSWDGLNMAHTLSAKASFDGCPANGKMKVTFPWTKIQNAPHNIVIIDTDYIAAYACIPRFGLYKVEYLWVGTQNRTRNDTVMATAYAAIDAMGLSRSGMHTTEHGSNCASLDP